MHSKHLRISAILIFLCFLPTLSWAHGFPPDTLRGIQVPKTPGLSNGSRPIIVSDQYARVLGKALFWDTNLGSDGMACASCHYHAGADERITNQMNPGQRHTDSVTGETFQPMASGALGGINYTLKLSDFPTYQLTDPTDRKSAVKFRSDDVIGSSGTNLGLFQSAPPQGASNDNCSELTDPIFHLGAKNTRRTTDRNAPSVINAAFNYRNFWDGRANNTFNGESPWGYRDFQAGAWVTSAGGIAKKRNLGLENASLASQAVGPPGNDAEMSCKQRGMADIGVKLLQRRALETQIVSPDDSALGHFAVRDGKGLKLTYEALIRKAFSKRYWDGKGDFGVQKNGTPYRMMEANFAMFFGLAVMEYEKTLISNQSPYDTPLGPGKVPKGLNDQQQRGLQIFLNAHCQNCHNGPTFSAAADPYLKKGQESGPVLVTRSSVDGSIGLDAHNVLRDIGFANTSVTPTDWDIGAGGSDPWGNPLAFAGEYSNAIAKGSVNLVDPVQIFACDFEVPFTFDWSIGQLQDPDQKYPAGKCKGYREQGFVPTATAWSNERALPLNGKAGVGTAGTFKIPTLRNVELTGPFMHNGSMKSLEEVIEFYDRGGNLINFNHFETFVFPQGFSAQDKTDLVAFLKSLTDERVRWERGPFDHPQITIPTGAVPGAASTLRANVNADSYEILPAVGKTGRSLAEGPLQPFEDALKP
ncbi:MAG: hypothetical protein RLZ25_971 [Pseudomonadota bacterium]|jgi:cytochrome c peroxidase